MRKNLYAIIMAGGRGERFWPVSTVRRPKQLISLIGGEPLLAKSISLLRGLVSNENIYVITNRELVKACAVVAPSIPAKNIIGEPEGRDTAAAVTLGMALAKARDPESICCVLTADHVIGDRPLFEATFRSAFDMAKGDFLITIGMKPSWPNTGFGYIEAGERLPSAGGAEFFKASRFVEKPNAETAAEYVASGNYYWNSGMFVWSAQAFETALAAHCPPLSELLRKLERAAAEGKLEAALDSSYPSLQKISIDYALMERARNVVMVKGDFSWDDVGSWTALENHIEKDEEGNSLSGSVELLDSAGNVAVAEQGVIALCGVHDLIVVRTDKATLICPKSRAQDVKRLVELLREKGLYEEVL